MLNEYLVKPIKEAWARFVEFVGGMETIKKVLKVIFMVMFAPVLAIPLLIWGVIKAFKMLVDKMGGFKSMMVKIFKAAFWPFFLWWDLVQKAKNFIGSFFGGGGGGKAPAAASPAVSMAAGGVVTKPTTATLGDAGPEAAVPLGNKFDLTSVEEKLDQLIAQDARLMNTLTKKVGDMGVSG